MADYIWPWPKGTLASQEFGTNPGGVNPAGGHTGLDAVLSIGTPLRAPRAGRITFEGWANINNNPYWLTDGGGICVAIDFGDGLPACIMGHLSATFVNVGDWVEQGQIIGESGNTGKWTTGPHCHLEFLPPVYNLNGPTYGRVNPRNYCTAYFEDTQAVVLPYQRETLTKVWQRTAPEHRNDANRIKLWDENLVFDFRGWTRGSDVEGNSTWFVSAYGDKFMHSSAFKDQGTHDLPELAFNPPTADFPHLKGIDVSNHQDAANLELIPSDFVIIKASEGVGWVDPALRQNVAEARAAGKLVGFYHFARPLAQAGNTARAEADSFLAAIREFVQPGDRLVLDWEAENQDRTDWAKEWLDYVTVQTDSEPFVYLNPGAINGGDWTAVEQVYPLWLAAYGANEPAGYNPQPKPTHTEWARGIWMWQYTSRGRLPGYDGDLDLNTYYGTVEDWKANGVGRVPVDPEPKPDPVPDPEPTPEFPGVDEPIRKLIEFYGDNA